MKFKKTIIITSISLFTCGIVALPIVFAVIHKKAYKTPTVVPTDPIVYNQSKLKVKDGVKTSWTLEEVQKYFLSSINDFVTFENFPIDTVFEIVNVEFKDNQYFIEITFDKYILDSQIHENIENISFIISIPFEKINYFAIEGTIINGLSKDFLSSPEYHLWDGVLHIPSINGDGEYITEIGDSAFRWNEKITDVVFEVDCKLHSIGKSAFEKTTSLQIDLIIPRTVTIIKEQAFYDSGIKSLQFDDNSQLIIIEREAFSSLKNVTGDLILPDKLETIGISGFADSPFDGVLYIPHGFKPSNMLPFGNGESYKQLSLWGKKVNWNSSWEKFGPALQKVAFYRDQKI
ncbi:MAG: leucine-rich repeat protein [Mycoplasma sp.]